MNSSENRGKSQDENFLLKDEIMQCVESLSVKCLSPATTLKLDANKNLPEKLAGDLSKFRLVIQSVSEFVMRYCTDGFIDIAINFDSINEDQKFLISFDFTFSKNPQFNEDSLVNMLNNIRRTHLQNYEEIILKYYEEMFDLISQFGIGMIIFPNLI